MDSSWVNILSCLTNYGHGVFEQGRLMFQRLDWCLEGKRG
jgi:hypothetical protein